MSLSEASCDRCAYRRSLGDVLRSYQIREGEAVTVRQCFAWCAGCRHAVFAEAIEDLAVLEAELSHARLDGEEYYIDLAQALRRPWPEVKTQHLSELELRIQWRKARSSPPRCFDCGAAEIVPFALVDEENEDAGFLPIEHPGCGGALRVESVGFSRSRSHVFYSAEGIKVATVEALPGAGLVGLGDGS